MVGLSSVVVSMRGVVADCQSGIRFIHDVKRRNEGAASAADVVVLSVIEIVASPAKIEVAVLLTLLSPSTARCSSAA